MTYSTKIKLELAELEIKCDECIKAFVQGFLLVSKLSTEKIVIMQDNRIIADFLSEMIVAVSGIIVSIHTPDFRKKNVCPSFSIIISQKNDINDLYKSVGLISGKQNYGKFKKECCKSSFARGIFFACGTLSDPNKEYDFELVLSDENLIAPIKCTFANINIKLKTVERKNKFVLYTKDSQQIEDILTYLGATKSSLELMNLKIEKDLRNKVNRVTNCETANIGKTVNASVTQINAINYILKNKGKDFLSPELFELANIRLNNPQSSLSELCDLIPYKISRSGVNHRLNKLCRIAKELSELK
ncbi:MAG: DNA-binding protein WhiA [Oscillospiraceae bacterium]